MLEHSDFIDLQKRILAFEKSKAAALHQSISVLTSLQKALGLPMIASVLTESLEGITNAVNEEELDAFLTCFIETLHSAQYEDVLEIDSCIKLFRQSADNLFYLTDLAAVSGSKLLEISGFLHPAEKAQEKFNHSAKKLMDEFLAEIDKNNQVMQELQKEQEAERERLQELNIKYHAGIKRIQHQQACIARALALLKNIQQVEDIAERENIRALYARELHQLHLLEPRAAYNHFLNACEIDAKELADARSSYLRRSDALMENTACKRNCPVEKKVNQLFEGNPLPKPPVYLTRLPKDFFIEYVETAELHTQRSPQETPQWYQQVRFMPADFQDRPGFLEKIGTFLLGMLGLFTSGLLCLTIIGIPFALTLGRVSMHALQALVHRKNFFVERNKKIERTEAVQKRLGTLRQNQTQLSPYSKLRMVIKKKSIAPLKSEAKIEMLLRGHKLNEILTEKELAEIKKNHQTSLRIKKEMADSTTVQPKAVQPNSSDSESQNKDNNIKLRH